VNFSQKNGFLSIAVLCVCLAVAVSVAAFQRHAPHKLRAIALLEVSTDFSGTTSAHLTPITILDNKRFHDASIYESRPRPMAIADGVVYEAQKTGLPVGYATVVGAQRKQDQWIVQGTWQLPSEVAPPKPSTPVALPAPGSDRPILRRPGSGEAQPPPVATAPTPPPAPTPVKSDPADPDRPIIRHKADPVPVASPAAPKPAQGVQRLVAVSDTEPNQPRSYEYIWTAGELQKAEAQMRKLALAQLPAGSRKGPPPELAKVVIRSFDLDLSNDAVMVLTAEVPGGNPAPMAKGAQPPAKPVTRYIAVIARLSFEGTLLKLSANVTDSSRLDVAPRLEFIDVVDADGDGLGDLLFCEYGFDQKSFVIYGIGRTTVTTMFEGAGQPLENK